MVREAARSEDRRNLLGCIEWSSPFARLDAASNALKQRLAVRILAEIKAPLFLSIGCLNGHILGRVYLAQLHIFYIQ